VDGTQHYLQYILENLGRKKGGRELLSGRTRGERVVWKCGGWGEGGGERKKKKYTLTGVKNGGAEEEKWRVCNQGEGKQLDPRIVGNQTGAFSAIRASLARTRLFRGRVGKLAMKRANATCFFYRHSERERNPV